ncbi:MAG TPA: hypothetical protein VFL89_00710 [Solirubrobacterales bacterium]|nr:hypothetical protein [Solirubrobacterales bacterium]
MERTVFKRRRPTYDDRLRASIMRGGRDAVQAAVTLMERHDPDSLEEALGLLPDNANLSPGRKKVLAEAWDRYFHIRGMSWD